MGRHARDFVALDQAGAVALQLWLFQQVDRKGADCDHGQDQANGQRAIHQSLGQVVRVVAWISHGAPA